MNRKLIWIAGGILPAIFLFAQAPKSAPKAAASAPVAADSISGKVFYTGPAIKTRPISMDATPACAREHKSSVASPEVIMGADKSVVNAFVYVKAGLPSKQYATPTAAVKLEQKGCMYDPHVLAVMVNQPIKIVNSDSTNHNIHPLPKVNQEWNESQAPGSPEKTKTFAREEIGLPVKCNVHPWMKSYIHVMSHPYFAITGADGSFTIKGLPAGEYTIGVWHEKFGEQEMKVKVGSKQDFTFKG